MATGAGMVLKSSVRPGGIAVCCAAGLLAGCCLANAEPIAVVELYTSQGCSSCPPADEALSRIATDPDVIALTFAVDYWDYLGWKDGFAKPEFTKRQKGYAAARGEHGVYTPQAIVNGREDVVGSDEGAIRATVRRLDDAGEGLTVDIVARVQGDRVIVTVPAGRIAPNVHAALWIAGYRLPEVVEISRGENKGRKVTYTNIVERWQVLGMWSGEQMEVELPLGDIAQDRTAGLAVILQSKADGRPGPILGAAKVTLPQS